jgi:hypothetical protein
MEEAMSDRYGDYDAAQERDLEDTATAAEMQAEYEEHQAELAELYCCETNRAGENG